MDNGSGGMVTVDDQGYPCQGGGGPTGPMGGSVDSGGNIVDNGLTIPLPPQLGCDPNDPTCSVAVIPGYPNGPCPQTDLTNSLPVGATLSSVNKNGTVTARSVVDINQVNAAASTVVVNNQTVVSNWVSVGWIYLDNNGGLWFQKDPAAQWTIAINVNINQYFGFAFTLPAATNPVYMLHPPTSSPLNSNLQTTKCFGKGKGLVPGTIASPLGPFIS